MYILCFNWTLKYCCFFCNEMLIYVLKRAMGYIFISLFANVIQKNVLGHAVPSHDWPHFPCVLLLNHKINVPTQMSLQKQPPMICIIAYMYIKAAHLIWIKNFNFLLNDRLTCISGTVGIVKVNTDNIQSVYTLKCQLKYRWGMVWVVASICRLSHMKLEKKSITWSRMYGIKGLF